jgi:hypothetical protein
VLLGRLGSVMSCEEKARLAREYDDATLAFKCRPGAAAKNWNLSERGIQAARANLERSAREVRTIKTSPRATHRRPWMLILTLILSLAGREQPLYCSQKLRGAPFLACHGTW